MLQGLVKEEAEIAQRIALQKNQINSVSKMLQTSIEPGGERVALDMLAKNEHQLRTVPGVLEWKMGIDGVFRKNRQVLKLTSKNLGSDTKFLQEFLSLKRNPAAAKKLELWSANPHNFNKLEKLMHKDKIFDIITKGKMTTRQKLMGVTLGDTAKRLGIGTAAVATAGGAIGVYSWFDDNDPKETATQAEDIVTNLRGLKVHGYGKTILTRILTTIEGIGRLSSKTNGGLSSNPVKASEEYVDGASRGLQQLHEHMQQWEIVVQSSSDQDKAREIGSQLNGLINKMATSLESAGTMVGIGATGAGAGVAGKTMTKSNNISKIQGFLRSNFNAGIRQTGELDRDTVQALRVLEQNFNRKSGDTRFTGLFVVPEANHVINYDDLVEAYRRITKY